MVPRRLGAQHHPGSGGRLTRPMRVHHVNLVVAPHRFDRSLSFWRDVLGFEEVERGGSPTSAGSWIRRGDAEIHLSVRDGEPHPEAHVALEVDDLGAIEQACRAAGFGFHPAPPVIGVLRGFTRDPGGNRVELIQVEAVSPATELEAAPEPEAAT